MNNGLINFHHEMFGDIRAIEIKNEVWFVGADVATALGYTNPRKALGDHVDDEDKNTVTIRDGIQGNPNKTIINESGLYSLVLCSKLPQAKVFKHWVPLSCSPPSVATEPMPRHRRWEGGRHQALLPYAVPCGGFTRCL